MSAGVGGTPRGNPAQRHYVGHHHTLTVEDWKALGWDQEHAEQYAAGRATQASVVVVEPDGVRPLEHHIKHSPTGFNWGYHGSGAADLARCILLDHYDLPPSTGESWTAPVMAVSYQQFKRDRIARLPEREPWSISSQEIDSWARTLERGGLEL